MNSHNAAGKAIAMGLAVGLALGACGNPSALHRTSAEVEMARDIDRLITNKDRLALPGEIAYRLVEKLPGGEQVDIDITGRQQPRYRHENVKADPSNVGQISLDVYPKGAGVDKPRYGFLLFGGDGPAWDTYFYQVGYAHVRYQTGQNDDLTVDIADHPGPRYKPTLYLNVNQAEYVNRQIVRQCEEILKDVRSHEPYYLSPEEVQVIASAIPGP